MGSVSGITEMELNMLLAFVKALELNSMYQQNHCVHVVNYILSQCIRQPTKSNFAESNILDQHIHQQMDQSMVHIITVCKLSQIECTIHHN